MDKLECPHDWVPVPMESRGYQCKLCGLCGKKQVKTGLIKPTRSSLKVWAKEEARYSFEIGVTARKCNQDFMRNGMNSRYSVHR